MLRGEEVDALALRRRRMYKCKVRSQVGRVVAERRWVMYVVEINSAFPQSSWCARSAELVYGSARGGVHRTLVYDLGTTSIRPGYELDAN